MTTISEDSPLALQLKRAIQEKAIAAGWATDDDDTSLAEYILLLVVNGKTQDEVATDLDGLLPEPGGTADFAAWLLSYVQKLMTGETDEVMDTAVAEPTQDEEVPAAYDNDLADNAPDNAYAEWSSFRSQSLTGDSPRGPKSLHGGPKGGRGGRGAPNGRNGFDSVLHRTRGNDRINSHVARGAPKGPKNLQNQRVNPSMQKALNGLASQQPSQQQQQQFQSMMQNATQTQAGQPSMTNISPQQQMEFLAMMEQQARMFAQFMPNMAPPGLNGGSSQQQQQQQQQNGRSMFDRVERGGRGGRGRGGGRGGHMHNNGNPNSIDENGQPVIKTGESTDPDGSAVTSNGAKDPSTTVCYFNLRCLNKECPYAHQSPAAPNGITIDMANTCSFGPACKNASCTGKHPSPALVTAHKAEQECKFWPNCTNPQCAFKHPSAPLCSFGASCTNKDCKFTHLQTKCKYNPCTNTRCPYQHEPGQSRSMAAYSWTKEQGNLGEVQARELAADQAGNDGSYTSSRRFVDDTQEEELIKPEADNLLATDMAT